MGRYRRARGIGLFARLTPEQQAEKLSERKERHEQRGGGFFMRAQAAIEKLVEAADDLFEDGQGQQRREWVVGQAVAFIKTPLGDPIERIIVLFLIELVLDRYDEGEIEELAYAIGDATAE